MVVKQVRMDLKRLDSKYYSNRDLKLIDADGKSFSFTLKLAKGFLS